MTIKKGEIIYDKKCKQYFVKIGPKQYPLNLTNDRDQNKGISWGPGDLAEFRLEKDRSGREIAKLVREISKRLPKDTNGVLGEKPTIDNFGLDLNKVVSVRKGKIVFGLSEVETVLDINEIGNNIPHRLKVAYEAAGFVVTTMVFKTDWRLVVGLGGASVHETSMTLHHVYGIPYIPGSAVKGTMRSWIISEVFDNDENLALNDPGFCRIFGSPEKSVLEAYQGNVWFADALPVDKLVIRKDVMSPHFGSYYRNGRQGIPPSDGENPIPITFLTVKNGQFQILLAIRDEDNTAIESGMFSGQTPLEVATQYLPEVLEEHGIGAKTSAGYGYMSRIE